MPLYFVCFVGLRTSTEYGSGLGSHIGVPSSEAYTITWKYQSLYNWSLSLLTMILIISFILGSLFSDWGLRMKDSDPDFTKGPNLVNRINHEVISFSVHCTCNTCTCTCHRVRKLFYKLQNQAQLDFMPIINEQYINQESIHDMYVHIYVWVNNLKVIK